MVYYGHCLMQPSGMAYLCDTTDKGFFVAMQSFNGPTGAPQDNGQGQVKKSIGDLSINIKFLFQPVIYLQDTIMKAAFKNSSNIKAITLKDFPFVKSTAEFLEKTSAEIKAFNPSGKSIICIDDLPASG